MRKKNVIAGIVTLTMLLGLGVGCGKEGTASNGDAANRGAFARVGLAYADSTKDGVYIQPKIVNDLFYLDEESGQFVFLCGKADCQHGEDNNTDCNAFFENRLVDDTVQVVDGKIYALGNPEHLDTNYVVYRMDLDGSNREVVTEVHFDGGVAGLRILGDELYFIGAFTKDDGREGDHCVYRQNLKDKDAEAVQVYPKEDEDEKWEARQIAELFVGDGKVYFKERRASKNLDFETSVWEYDVKKDEISELFHTNKESDFFVENGWIYYSEYTPSDKENESVSSQDVLKKTKIDTGETEETTIPRGEFLGADGTYCYMYFYEKGTNWKVESINIYTLDGSLIEKIDFPEIEYEKGDYLTISSVPDAIIIYSTFPADISE